MCRLTTRCLVTRSWHFSVKNIKCRDSDHRSSISAVYHVITSVQVSLSSSAANRSVRFAAKICEVSSSTAGTLWSATHSIILHDSPPFFIPISTDHQKIYEVDTKQLPLFSYQLFFYFDNIWYFETEMLMTKFCTMKIQKRKWHGGTSEITGKSTI